MNLRKKIVALAMCYHGNGSSISRINLSGIDYR